ncbi:MAG: diguanylate cyclase [Pseudanabaenaceae cyanobacterium bins.68]|nr:diguanylate cyclase [Pseudanabaenaceae cyanobacterium bins.68]
MNHPKLFRVAQKFEQSCIDCINTAVRSEIARIAPPISPGQSVAVAVGSRGIDRHHLIVKAVIDYLLDLEAQPYIVPAMGSHGGATADGQAAILAGFGIDEQNMGVPVRASMEVVQLGKTEFGMPVYFDRWASEADHLVLVNRIKPHTRFAGKIESGLVKMLAIGLGKQVGASTYHKAFANFSFDRVVRSIYEIVRDRIPVAFGLAVLENGYQKTAQVTAVPAVSIVEIEEQLLRQAKTWFPGLPFREVDILIIDQVGKDISGAGMDTNVTGLKRLFCDQIEGELPQIKRIYLRDLTDASRGNAMGFGLADFVSTKLVNKVDFTATYMNAVTGQNLRGAATPVHFDSDRQVLGAAFSMIGAVDPENAKIIWIKNTRDLTEVELSCAYLEAVVARLDLQVLTGLRSPSFDQDGNLPDFDQFGQVGLFSPEQFLDRGIDEQMKLELQRWTLLDDLTHVLNRHSFELCLEQKWQQSAIAGLPLTLILVKIAPLPPTRSFNDLNDDCLIEIARLIGNVPQSDRLVARYELDCFALLLGTGDRPEILTTIVAVKQALGLMNVFQQGHFGFRFGIANTKPRLEISAQKLIDLANQCLGEAQQGDVDFILHCLEAQPS